MKITLDDKQSPVVSIFISLDDIAVSSRVLLDQLTLSEEQLEFYKRPSLDVDRIKGSVTSLYLPHTCIRISEYVPRSVSAIKNQSKSWYKIEYTQEDDFRGMVGDMNANLDSSISKKPLGISVSIINSQTLKDSALEMICLHRDISAKKSLLHYRWYNHEIYSMAKRVEILEKLSIPYKLCNTKLRTELFGLTSF